MQPPPARWRAGAQRHHGIGVTCRPGRHTQRFECKQQALALDALDADIEDSGETALERTIQHNARHVRDSFPEPVAQFDKVLEIIRHRLPRNLGRSAEADNLLSRLRARSQAALLTAAVEYRFNLHARPIGHVKRADAFGTIDLVRCHRHQVDRQLAEVDRQLAN
jgi:hypothetical protein